MNNKEIAERKKYLSLQVFYLKIKQLIGDLEEKYPELVYSKFLERRKG